MPNYSIKDKENLFNFNVWSGTDYNSLHYGSDYITGHLIIISSDKYHSSNGDYSIKLSSQETAWFRFPVNISTGHIGKTVNISADIYSPTNIISSHILLYNNDELLKTLVAQIPTNNHFTKITLSTTILENTNKAFFNISCPEGAELFVDNITINIQ